MQRRCAGASFKLVLSCVSIHVADRGRCSPITCASTHAHCARTQHTHGTPIHTSRATKVSLRTMPLKSMHTHAHTSRPAAYPPMHMCINITLLWYYGSIIYDCGHARLHVLILCGRAPYSRAEHAAGNHSSSAKSSMSMLTVSHTFNRCIACHTSRRL
jgi:hypothetical protein